MKAKISLKKLRKAGLVTNINQAAFDDFIEKTLDRYVDGYGTVSRGLGTIMEIPEELHNKVTEAAILEAIKIRCERMGHVKLVGGYADYKYVRDIMVYGVLGYERPALEDSVERDHGLGHYTAETYNNITSAIS